MNTSPGSRVDHYEIVELIGRGGMGEVYRARDTRLPRDAAIKVSVEKFSERFAREASIRDGIYFVAQPGGKPPVDFRLATTSGSEIVFVNPGHADHLKRIIYRRSGSTELTARIEGEDGGKPFAVDYVYRASATAACP